MMPDHPTKPRLLLDVTIAATTDLNTGIQRVVRNISRYSEKVSAELNIDCVPIVCRGEQMSAVGFDGRARLDERCCRLLQSGWMAMHKSIAGLLSKLIPKSGEGYLTFLSRLRKLLIPKTLVRGIGNSYRRLTGQSVSFRDNDVLVLLDASWDLQLDKILKLAHEQKVPVATVVYDLIPILHPQFHSEQLKEVFARWFDLVVKNSDLMIGISKTVQNDLVPFVQQDKRLGIDQANCQLASFRLGSDFATTELSTEARTSTNSSRSRAKHGWDGYYLAVGTIEPRKNHAYLLDAFDRLWQSGAELNLVIVGKVGWMCDDVVRRIQEHQEFNRRLFFLEQVDDEDLHDLYHHARALVFPSIVEGFGLPIVEAFRHRLPVLASDTPIHREVAGDNALFFGLEDPQELVDLIHRIEAEETQLIEPAALEITWEQSCREFLSIIKNYLDSKSDARRSMSFKEAA